MRDRAKIIVDIISFIAEIWYKIAVFFTYVSDFASEIPFVGYALQLSFLEIADIFFEWYDFDLGITVETCLYHRTIELGFWLLDVSNAVDTILPWSAIQAEIKKWLTGIETLVFWFSDWWNNVRWAIDAWWVGILDDVKTLIAIATEGLASLLTAWTNFWDITWPEWTTKLDTLKTEWDTFWTVTYPTLVSNLSLTTWWDERLKDVNKLIRDILKIFLPFRDDLVSLWDDIAEFFADPEDWLYKAADRIIERFW